MRLHDVATGELLARLECEGVELEVVELFE
jgi:hypothetical protein